MSDLHGDDRVDLGDEYARTCTSERLSSSLPHITVAADERDLPCDHHVGRSLQAVHRRLSNAVQVVKLALQISRASVRC